MIRFTFKKGLRFIEDTRTWTLLRRLVSGKLQFEDEQGEVMALAEAELLKRWINRNLIVDEASLSNGGAAFYLATPRDLSTYKEKDQAIAKRRHLYLTRLESGSDKIASRGLDSRIREIAEEIGDESPPSSVTVYRWWRMYKPTGSVTRLVDGRCKSGRRRNESANHIFEEVLAEIYLNNQRHPPLAVYEEMRRKISRVNQDQPAGKIVCPSRATVYRWLARLEQHLVDQARLGKRAAERKYRAVLGQVKVRRILERVEIDHSPLDLIVIDQDSALPLGRPWLTVALDRYSRAILGFYVGFHEPSSYSVLQCLKRAILPKDEWLAQFQDIEGIWPCHGIPVLIATDNGMDLHSEAFKELCQEMGIQLLFCPAGEPEYKGAVERFFRTISQGLIHRLPGTVFSNIKQRGDYPSEEVSAIDLATLMHLITKWVVEIYHCTPHKKLGMTPLAKWMEGLGQRAVELPAYPESLDVLVGIPISRTLFRYGLEVESMLYNSEELQQLFLRSGAEKKLKLKLKYYEDDVGYVHVFDPFSEVYIRVEAVDQEYAQGLHRHVHRLIVESVRRQHRDGWNQARLLEAKAEIQDIVAKAIRHKKMAVRKRSARLQQLDSEAILVRKRHPIPDGKSHKKAPRPTAPPLFESGLEDELPTFKTSVRTHI